MPSRLSAPMTLARATRETTAVAPASALLDDLLRTSLVLQEDWQLLPDQTRKDLLTAPDRAALLAGLVEHGLLTDYQSARIGSISNLIGKLSEEDLEDLQRVLAKLHDVVGAPALR